MDERMHRLQELLALIRACTGWTAAILGEKLGVSRQMISSIETGRNTLTITQYRALRQVFDEEIAAHPKETRIIQDIFTILVDQPEDFNEDARKRVLSDATMIAQSIASKQTSRRIASNAWDNVLIGKTVISLVFSKLPYFSSTAAIIAGSVAPLWKSSHREETSHNDIEKEAHDND